MNDLSAGEEEQIFHPVEEGRFIIRTDPHSHILPGMDDGSRNFEMSITMGRRAASFGVQNMVATPHANHPASRYDYDADEVRERVAELNRIFREQRINIRLYPGMELLMTEALPEKMESGKLLSWADQKKYVLIELGFHKCPACSWEVLDFMQGRGLTPIIAHPERYTWWPEQLTTLHRLVERGCIFQINVMSINGLWGENTRSMAFHIMRESATWMVGTDSHSDADKFWGIDKVRDTLHREGIWSEADGPGVERLANVNVLK
jgi:tyrosine-protein phosphatase YwqE